VLIVSGFWMAATAWSFSLFWVRAALFIALAVLILMYLLVAPGYGRLPNAIESEGLASAKRQQPERITQLIGGGSSLLIILVIWLMVGKPS
jgi:hypothetical protein